MTDRELLESAARAAGYTLHIWGAKGAECVSRMDTLRPTRWNPLEDDGDALRLAVKLQLTVCNEHVNAGQVYCMRGDEAFPSVESGTICDGPVANHVIPEDYAATRRAITRAAAAIGEKVK